METFPLPLGERVPEGRERGRCLFKHKHPPLPFLFLLLEADSEAFGFFHEQRDILLIETTEDQSTTMCHNLTEGRHIILLHAHNETDELVPGYYRLLLDDLLNHGVQFVKPDFV